MKKIYIQPRIVVVEVEVSKSMLAGSNYDTSSADTQNGGSFGSRQSGGFWDDED